METRSLGDYYDIAKQLGPLREEDVPIIGSWNIVQNLRVADMYAMDAKTVPVGS